MGGWGKHAWILPLSPRQKIRICISSKNLRLEFASRIKNLPARRILSTRRFAPRAKIPLFQTLTSSLLLYTN